MNDPKAHEPVPYSYTGCGCEECETHRKNWKPMAGGLEMLKIEKGFKERYSKTKDRLREALGLLQISSINGHAAGCLCDSPMCVKRRELLALWGRL